MQDIPLIFDDRVKRLHRARSALTLSEADFLFREAAHRIAERFDGEITQAFPDALEMGVRAGHLMQLMQGKAGIKRYCVTESCEAFFDLIIRSSDHQMISSSLLPQPPQKFDLILSSLNLHWVNDLPGMLVQIRERLNKKGLFMATLLGGATLKELREACMRAETKLGVGFSPRISPMIQTKDAGILLQRAGFKLPVADSEIVTVTYKDAFALMNELSMMGESNALVKRRNSLNSKRILLEIAGTYERLFQQEDGKIPATFEIVTLTGWKT